MTGTYNPDVHHRKSIRLRDYDYSQSGAYFVTICTKNKECLLGDVVDGKIVLNDIGKFVQQCWLNIPEHFPNGTVDEYIIMPNHIHGIVIITVGANNYSPLQNEQLFQSPSRTIGSIIRGFKIGVTKWSRQNTDMYTLWQRNYYEHIIRNEGDMNTILEYIVNNPLRWMEDENNPVNFKASKDLIR